MFNHDYKKTIITLNLLYFSVLSNIIDGLTLEQAITKYLNEQIREIEMLTWENIMKNLCKLYNVKYSFNKEEYDVTFNCKTLLISSIKKDFELNLQEIKSGDYRYLIYRGGWWEK